MRGVRAQVAAHGRAIAASINDRVNIRSMV
jgi:hypothetical protein